MARGRTSLVDSRGGTVFGTALWLFGDEIAVPLSGLQAGPTAVSGPQHLNRWGAHLIYGMATSLGTQLLHRLP